ncbi:MAG: hypothetical protein Q4A66_01845 [Eubacteriales bacterium]|nr:hypothetical protein [Eubacteriales bacterium]
MSVLYPAQGQAQLWLEFCAAGAAAALLSGLIGLFFPGRLRALGDLLSGCAAGLLLCGTCVLRANGVMRAYMLVALLIGASGFVLLLGLPLRRLLRPLSSALAQLARRVGSCAFLRRLLR